MLKNALLSIRNLILFILIIWVGKVGGLIIWDTAKYFLNPRVISEVPVVKTEAMPTPAAERGAKAPAYTGGYVEIGSTNLDAP